MRNVSGKTLFMAFSLVFCFAIFGGCREKRDEGANNAVGIEKSVEIEPFLAPEVTKITGKEDEKGDKAAIRNLIIRYNAVVVLSNINIESVFLLKDLTTRKEFTRIYASLEKDRSEGKILSCTLRNLAFKEISVEGKKGMATTIEDWFYEDRDLKTGKVLTPLTDTEYEVEYRIIKEDHRWMLEGIDIRKAADYMPPRGEPKRVKINVKEVGNNGKNK